MQWDTTLFFLVNKTGQHAVLDTILPVMRNKYIWAPLYLFIISFLVINYRWKGTAAVVFLLITVGIGDQLSSAWIKPTVERLRPCHTPAIKDQVRLLVECGGKWSFPSSHATNHFGVAVFLIGVLRRWMKWLLPLGLLWAALISYAQVYVGVHFPVDVTVGALLGTTSGLLTYGGYRLLVNKLIAKKQI